jgi:hypothetical protein
MQPLGDTDQLACAGSRDYKVQYSITSDIRWDSECFVVAVFYSPNVIFVKNRYDKLLLTYVLHGAGHYLKS